MMFVQPEFFDAIISVHQPSPRASHHSRDRLTALRQGANRIGVIANVRDIVPVDLFRRRAHLDRKLIAKHPKIPVCLRTPLLADFLDRDPVPSSAGQSPRLPSGLVRAARSGLQPAPRSVHAPRSFNDVQFYQPE